MFNWYKKEAPFLGIAGFGGGIASRLIGVGGFTVTGGTTVVNGDFTYHYFTHPGGSYPLSPHPTSVTFEGSPALIDVLLVAGGGGGGSDAGGGGGGGGVIKMTQHQVAAGTYPLTIGYGGQKGIGGGSPYTIEDQGKPGGNTTGFGETAIGGGGGGRGQGGTDTSPTREGLPGGSGGGGGGFYPGSTPAGMLGGNGSQPVVSPVSVGYANPGMRGRFAQETGGGGGGAGFGRTGRQDDGPQNGGDGIRISEFAGIIPNDPGVGYFAGGGGAGGWVSSPYSDGFGGLGGGGNGGGFPGNNTGVGGNAVNNLGGGGGGGNQTDGGNGGHGTIILRYLTNSARRAWLIATGGSVIPSASSGTGYKYHVFTSPGTFTVSASGYAHILMVAGGGGGGGNNSGGGGAGGVIKSESYPITAGTYNISVGLGGAGGATATTAGSPGGNTTAFGLTAIGGGGSGYWTGGNTVVSGGGAGGSGAGGPGNPTSSPSSYPNAAPGTQRSQPGDSGIFGYGNPGGNSFNTTIDIGGGGGGGAGSQGSMNPGPGNVNGTHGGAGGDGLKTGGIFAGPVISPAIPAPNAAAFQSAVGSDGYYAAGGGGASGGQSMPYTVVGGVGGNGGGGPGGSANAGQNGTPGVFATGSGGGGGDNTNGGSGGQGIVIIAYKD